MDDGSDWTEGLNSVPWYSKTMYSQPDCYDREEYGYDKYCDYDCDHI